MSGTHPSEIARLEIAAHWDRDRAQYLAPPGSFAEEALLQSIEERRLEELAELRAGRMNAGSRQRVVSRGSI